MDMCADRESVCVCVCVYVYVRTVELFSSIEHLLDVLLHDAGNVREVFCELGGVASGGWVEVLPSFALDELVKLDKGIRPCRGFYLSFPSVGMCVCVCVCVCLDEDMRE
jgi:hypothetical protein